MVEKLTISYSNRMSVYQHFKKASERRWDPERVDETITAHMGIITQHVELSFERVIECMFVNNLMHSKVKAAVARLSPSTSLSKVVKTAEAVYEVTKFARANKDTSTRVQSWSKLQRQRLLTHKHMLKARPRRFINEVGFSTQRFQRLVVGKRRVIVQRRDTMINHQVHYHTRNIVIKFETLAKNRRSD